jgi:LmbE family N-acetylglucosaminyl deacetylase
MVHHVYLSPHLDDAVLSCGGLIAAQTGRGDIVTVLTLFAGDPPPGPLSPFAQELHARWGSSAPVAARREEDREACRVLGARVVQLDNPEAIYRSGGEGEHLYASEEAIFGDVHPLDASMCSQLAASLLGACMAADHVSCPLGYGGHVDHRLVRQVVPLHGCDANYYQDFPYAARGLTLPPDLALPSGRWATLALEERWIERWIEAVSCYRSQLSTFWEQREQLEGELRAYHAQHGGIRVLEVE